MTPLDHALAYAEAGFPVFPCRARVGQGAKAPHLPGETAPGLQDGGHWLASAEAETIRGWWRRWPDALIGFPTGLRSSCVVVDLDPKAATVETMLAALARWCGGLEWTDPQTGEVIPPALARTQSGGFHLYFAWPDAATMAEIDRNLARLGQRFERVIGNRANTFRAFLEAQECPPELANIDVRGEGGYVVAPPSRMSDGRTYEWLLPPGSFSPPADAAGEPARAGPLLPPLPRRLRGVITGEFIPEAEKRRRAEARALAASYRPRALSDRRVGSYVERSVRGALGKLGQAGNGNRNACLFWAACRLGEFVRGGVLAEAEAEALLLGAAPLGGDFGPNEARKTIRSGLRNTKTPAFSPAQLQDRETGRAA